MRSHPDDNHGRQTGGKPPVGWAVLGVFLIVATFAVGPLGFGGGAAIGMRELALLMAGVAFLAPRFWVDGAPMSAGRCMLVFVWIGLLAGWVDVVSVTVSCWVLETVKHKPDGYVWMMPAAYTALFAVFGMGCSLAVRLLPRCVTLPVVVCVPSIFVVWSVLRPFGWLDEFAALALAVGGATALGRLAAANPAGFLKMCRVTALVLGGLTVVAATVIPVSARLRESEALANLPQPRDGSPNVLLIVLDTVRLDHLGLYGYERPTTPAIDELAQSGVVFDWAIAPAPWTLTTHAGMFTGRYPHEMTADWKVALDDTHPTLAEALSANGYATAGFVGNLFYCGAENGIARGFSRYDDRYLSARVLMTAPSLGQELVRRTIGEPQFVLLRNPADEITDRFLDWAADRQQEDRPFFAFLNFFDAHAAYLPPPGYETMFGPRIEYLDLLQRRKWRRGLWGPKADNQPSIDAYDACIRFIDDQIQRLLAELQQRGVLDDTLVIITGDHGELFGEHKLYEHANSLYLPLLQAPLVFRMPGKVPAGKRIDRFVSLVDLPATVLDLLGLERPAPMPGHSLARLWAGDPATAPVSPVLCELSKGINLSRLLPASKGDMKSIFVDGLRLILNGDGTEQLFDVRADRAELKNLIDERPADAARLRAALQRAASR